MSVFPWQEEVILPLSPVWETILAHRGQVIGGYKITGVKNQYGLDDGRLLTVSSETPTAGHALIEFKFSPCSYRLEDLSELHVGTGDPGRDPVWALGRGRTIDYYSPLGEEIQVHQAWRGDELCLVYVTRGACWADWSSGRTRQKEPGCRTFRGIPTALTKLRHVFGEPILQRINSKEKAAELLERANIAAFVAVMEGVVGSSYG